MYGELAAIEMEALDGYEQEANREMEQMAQQVRRCCISPKCSELCCCRQHPSGILIMMTIPTLHVHLMNTIRYWTLQQRNSWQSILIAM